MPKVSVIVPFYNSEKYIGRCAASLFNQTIDDIEFIFIDDHSSDNSINVLKNILSDFPDRQRQTVILSNELNLGSSLSRQRGYKAAKGEYVIGCDSDDCVDPQMYELLYNEATRENFDVVVCDFYRIFSDGRQVPSAPQKPSGDFLEDLLLNRLDNYLWNKLIKRKIFENPLLYPTASIWEDVGLISQLAAYCSRVTWVNRALYHYYVNPESLMNGKTREKLVHDMTDNIHIVEEFLRTKNLLEKYSSALIRHKEYVLSFYFDSPRADYLNVFPEIRIKLFFSPYVPFPKKLGHMTKLLGIHGVSKFFHNSRQRRSRSTD